jgi:cytochrome oxidase Cu insertion factor (SCO1/SenC/PrrC family)
MKIWIHVAMLLALTASATAQEDDFRREDNKRIDRAALEGKAPPALQVTDWMNTDGKELTLDSLRGKVVVIDFWGTW